MDTIFLVHEILEWFNCPKRMFRLHYQGCISLTQASHLREQMRVFSTFLDTYEPKVPPYQIKQQSLEECIKESKDIIINRQHNHISQAVISHGNLAVFIPYLHWNNAMEGWYVYLPSPVPGLRQEHLHLASLLSLIFQNNDIPIAKILLTHYSKSFENVIEWIPLDITVKTNKYLTKEQETLKKLVSLIESPDANSDTIWESCNKQYCDVCQVRHQYEVDDIRTLRKAKHFIEELQSNNITQITQIPQDQIPNNNIINRQIQAVYTQEPVFIIDEINDFLQKLQFPRYYLDFEAFSTSIPYSYPPPYIAKAGAFTPFLFSIQKQEIPHGPIHTQLRAMIPGKNQIKIIWNSLKSILEDAGSIIVYDSQFEHEMIQQLSTTLSENTKGAQLLEKIVDLQEIFFHLSLYHPEQKGKISLKTITPIWTNGDYQQFKVNEGIAANYYYTALTDEKLGIFDSVKSMPYFSRIFELISKIEEPIRLEDIVEYCKYDTAVMIKIVDVIELMAEKYNNSNN